MKEKPDEMTRLPHGQDRSLAKKETRENRKQTPRNLPVIHFERRRLGRWIFPSSSPSRLRFNGRKT